jgi:hypothetical protein
MVVIEISPRTSVIRDSSVLRRTLPFDKQKMLWDATSRNGVLRASTGKPLILMTISRIALDLQIRRRGASVRYE